MSDRTNPDQDLTQSNEHCRSCKGTGGGSDSNGDGTYTFIPCFYCNGSGKQSTMRVPA